MSASREWLYEELLWASVSATTISQRLDEYRDEVLRDHAQVIRMMAFRDDGKQPSVIGPYSAADLIDPEVQG